MKRKNWAWVRPSSHGRGRVPRQKAPQEGSCGPFLTLTVQRVRCLPEEEEEPGPAWILHFPRGNDGEKPSDLDPNRPCRGPLLAQALSGSWRPCPRQVPPRGQGECGRQDCGSCFSALPLGGPWWLSASRGWADKPREHLTHGRLPSICGRGGGGAAREGGTIS